MPASVRPVDQVYPLLDAANSRWFFFASACRPFGMVTLHPDTQVGGAWGSGYKYDTDTIKGFSHIHGWQISGVSVMPVTFNEAPDPLLTDYYSAFSHDKEHVRVGYHKVVLDRYQVTTELTSTRRVGLHRYHFPRNESVGIVFQLEGILGPSMIKDGRLVQVGPKTLSGQLTNGPTKRRPKDVVAYFEVAFDKAIAGLTGENKGNKLVTFPTGTEDVMMKVAISYTSNENARLNMREELPGWDFDQVVENSQVEWDVLLSRIVVKDDDSLAVRRFYTDLWHSLQGRRTISDVNGAYPDNTGEMFRVGQLPQDSLGKPKFSHYNSDAFWGAQWTLNTLWGLLYPKRYEEFVNSLLVYYQDGGLIPRGPSGGNYTYVMTGASSTPFIVSAYQKGLRGFDAEVAYEGMKKNHMPGGIMGHSGYEHGSASGGGLEDYIEHGYVPYPNPDGDFGYHQDGASLTLEYAYQDWALAQMAKALGKKADYDYFLGRSENYKNQFDQETGWMRPKDINGQWRPAFDPYEYEHGFNESNGAQSTWFVPHDVHGLAALMGGEAAAVKKLNAQFEKAALMGFTAGTSHERGEDPNRARVPINYGNQPSIQTAFIFNHLGRPDLTQYWSGEVAKKAFGGLSPHTGYNGDEDQGLMGSLAVLLKLGLFQMNGGTEEDPRYEFGSPMFDQVLLHLPNDKSLELLREGEGVFIEELTYNGKTLTDFFLTHTQLMEGGILKFKMSEQLNSKE